MTTPHKFPFQRVSPLEEFNALYRNKDMVRASIKLKESNVV